MVAISAGETCSDSRTTRHPFVSKAAVPPSRAHVAPELGLPVLTVGPRHRRLIQTHASEATIDEYG